MTDQQTEIPIDTGDKKNKPPVSNSTDTITILASLPWTFADPQCCMKYSAELWQDERDQVYVTFTHDDDCEVWRFLP